MYYILVCLTRFRYRRPVSLKEKLHVSIAGSGSLSGSAGHYTATVGSISDNDVVTVSGEVDGKNVVLGSTKFRVKRIPDPKAQFAGKSDGSTSSVNIKAQNRVFAKLENFEFDATFNVTRFTLIVVKPRADPITIPTNGPDLSARCVLHLIRSAAARRLYLKILLLLARMVHRADWTR